MKLARDCTRKRPGQGKNPTGTAPISLHKPSTALALAATPAHTGWTRALLRPPNQVPWVRMALPAGTGQVATAPHSSVVQGQLVRRSGPSSRASTSLSTTGRCLGQCEVRDCNGSDHSRSPVAMSQQTARAGEMTRP